MKGTRYTFIFAAIICGVCSILLSAVSEGLKKQQTLNAELEIKKNILKAVQLQEPLHPQMKSQEIVNIYENKIEELVIDKEGNIVEGKKPADLKETDNQLINAERADTSIHFEWRQDDVIESDTANYLTFQIGYMVSDKDGENPRFTTDAWIYVDTLHRKFYEYDIAKDSLILKY